MQRWLIAWLAAGIVVSACGGREGDGDAATSTGAVTSASTTGAPPAVASTAGDTAGPTGPPSTGTTPTTLAAGATVAIDDPGADRVREVPREYDTIQSAVDAAQPGDLVLLAPGTYHEAVDVTTAEIVVRGLDRDTVVLDGRLDLDNGFRVLGADGVAVENLTVANYTNNGVFFVSVDGYRASYVTTYRTGDYGIYAFDSVRGEIEHSTTIGSRDAGVYIGQCAPCDALVDDVVSAYNALGYSGTNSGGNLLIVNSVWHNNRIGILPNSGSYELCYPQRETTIVGNLVYDNNQPDTAAFDFALAAQRAGILVAGGIGNVIERNRIDDHGRIGIGLVPYPEDTPNDDQPSRDEWSLTCEEQKQLPIEIPDGRILWDSYDHVVRGNVVTGSGEADLVVAAFGTDLSTLGHCFEDNDFTTSAPLDIERLAPCAGESEGDWTAGDGGAARWLREPSGLPGAVAWQDAPLPPLGPQPSMPDAATAPPRPATDVPRPIDLGAIGVPSLADG